MIKANSVFKTYDGVWSTPAPITFHVDEKTPLAILEGENGSGKTTLLKILLGEEVDNSGFFKVSDRDQLTVMYQQDGLIPKITAIENVNIAAKDKLTSRISLLDAGLTEDKHHTLACHLSGGEQRKVQLARCIASRRRFWILDEPSSFVDFSFQKILMNKIYDNLAAKGLVLMTSHDESFKSSLSTYLNSFGFRCKRICVRKMKTSSSAKKE